MNTPIAPMNAPQIAQAIQALFMLLDAEPSSGPGDNSLEAVLEEAVLVTAKPDGDIALERFAWFCSIWQLRDAR